MKNYSLLILYICCLCLALAGCGMGNRDYHVDRAAYPVKGIDISAHNGAVDFDRVRADSVTFVLMKATEGADFCDAMYDRNAKGARKAGLKVGAYHFFRFETPGHLQAYGFLTAVNNAPVDLPLAIDVENWKNADGVPKEEIVTQLAQMIGVLREAGYRVMIYTNKDGYEQYVKGNFDDVDLWLSSLGAEPEGEWTMWQHSHCGSVDGIDGYVDINTYDGTERDFACWLEQGADSMAGPIEAADIQ